VNQGRYDHRGVFDFHVVVSLVGGVLMATNITALRELALLENCLFSAVASESATPLWIGLFRDDPMKNPKRRRRSRSAGALQKV
jgi:hypothetical protein